MKALKKYTIEVRGLKWSWIVLSKTNYTKLHGSDSQAITVSTDKRVYVKAGHVTKKIVDHEMWHVYCSTLYVHNSNPISLDQYEELQCEMREDYSQVIHDQIQEVYDNIKPKGNKEDGDE